MEKFKYHTFWENQSGGRPGSAKGLIALLTDTLEGKKVPIKIYHSFILKNVALKKLILDSLPRGSMHNTALIYLYPSTRNMPITVY